MERELEEFGLTPVEVKVYLACLNIGTGAVQEIAKKADDNIQYTHNKSKIVPVQRDNNHTHATHNHCKSIHQRRSRSRITFLLFEHKQCAGRAYTT